MPRNRLNVIFKNMKQRCYNPNNPEYKNYGGRGITICSEWLNKENAYSNHNVSKGYLAFKEWAFSHGYADNLTIERRDINGNYCPENCTWIPRSEQYFNRTDTRYITYLGKTQSLGKWCKELGMSYQVVRGKLRYGASVEEAFEYGTRRI